MSSGSNENRGRAPRPFLPIALIVLAVIVPVRNAAAHADLVKTTPATGGHVDVGPAEVALWYTERLQHGVIVVQDQNNNRVDTGLVVIDPNDERIVRVPLRELSAEPGIYTLRWEVLSDDGHTTSGSFFFLVGGVVLDRDTILGMFAPVEEGGYRFNPLEPVLRGLLLISIVALLGIPPTSRFAICRVLQGPGAPLPAAAEAERRIRRLVALAAFILLVDSTALALLRTTTAFGSIGPSTLAAFAATGLGRMWILQTAVAIIVLFVCLMRIAALHLAAPAAGVVAGWSVASSSHSATYVTGVAGILADIGHIVGAGLWAGGLLAMALIAGPVLARLPRPIDRRLAARVVARFSLFALFGLGLAVSTGLVIASWHVPSPKSLLTTLYGSSLTAKILLVLAGLTLGATARLYVLRLLHGPDREESAVPADGVEASSHVAEDADRNRSPVRLLRAIVGAEAALLVLVLLSSGLMTSAPTALAASHTAPKLGSVERRIEMGGGRVLLNIVPTQIGLNVFDVRILDGAGAPAAAEDVVFVLRHPRRDIELNPIKAEPVEPGLWSAVSAVSMDGVWSLRVEFWRDGAFYAQRFHFPVASQGLAARMREAAIPPPTAEAGGFRLALRVAAVLAALLTFGALTVEAVRTVRTCDPVVRAR